MKVYRRRVRMMCSAALLAAPAFAAAQTLSESGVSTAAEASKPDEGIADIIVTAQRREERLQDVPIAVTVIGGGKLSALALTQTRDLATVVPGLVQNQKSFAVLPYLRGIGTNLSAGGIEPPVVTYVDGMYVVSPVAATSDLADVERIEVLRGPQGTLFGRNAAAGVINITTRTPQADPHFDAQLAYSSFRTVEGKLYLTGGLAENLAGSIAVSARDQNEGWGRNTVGNFDLYRGKSILTRGKLQWKPSDALTVDSSAYYSYGKDDSSQFRLLPGAVGRVSGVNYTNNTGFYDSVSNPGFFNKESYGGYLKASLDLGSVTLKNLAAYQHVKVNSALDSDYTPAQSVYLAINFTDKAFTNEIQLTSNANTNFNWLLGFFYLRQSTDQDILQTGTGVTGGSLGAPAQQKTTSYAPFANATWEFLEGTKLTVGLRYTSDLRKLAGASFITPTAVTPLPNQKKRFNKFTPKVSLDHRISDKSMVYASYSRGFAAGFFNLSAAVRPPLEPAVLDAFEVGAKTEFFDRKLILNFALFHYDYSNIAVRALPPGAVNVALINAAKARINGLDVDMIVRPAPGLTISGGFEYLPRAKYLKFPGASLTSPNPLGGNSVTIGDAAGNRLIQAPKFSSVISVQYEAQSAIGEFHFGANYSYRSHFFFTEDNRLKQSGYGLVSASADLAIEGSPFTVGVFARNLFDKKYNSDMATIVPSDYGLPGEPQVLGVRVGVEF